VKRTAFSLLELIATLLIATLVCFSVLLFLNRTYVQGASIQQELSRLSAVQYSLDGFLNDVITTAQGSNHFEVENTTYSGHETSRVTMIWGVSEEDEKPPIQIDWVGVPRNEEKDLVLYRRESKTGDETKSVYLPICYHLHSFRVFLLDAEGEPVESSQGEPSLIDIEVEYYRTDPPDVERMKSVSRTFCLKRFQSP